MTVAYVNAGALYVPGSVASAPLPMPSSVVAGNLLLAVFRANLSGTTVTWPGGWTVVSEVTNGSGQKASLAYRVATGSGDQPTLTVSPADNVFGAVFQYSGVTSVGTFSSNFGTSSTHTCAAFTTTIADSASVFVDIDRTGTTVNLGAASGWTDNASLIDGFSDIAVDTGLKTGLGVVGSSSGAVSASGGTNWMIWQLELAPAAAPSGTSDANIPQLTGAISGFTGNASDGSIPQLTGSISGKRIFDETVNSGVVIATDVGAGGLIELSASSIAAISSAGFPGSILTADANSAMLLQSIALAPRVFVETAGSGMTAATSGAATKAATVTGSSVFVAVAGGQAQAIYILSAESVAALMTGTQFVMDFTDGWAYNLNTGAPSFYEGMKFNSFAMIGGEYYGCNETGIHRLTGDKDGADNIRATITLGTSRLDSDREKAVPVAYVGARSAEPMLLTCRVEGEEFSYEFSRETAVMAPARVKPGKGLKGVYWEFEIENQNGADLDLDTLEVVTAPGSRRV